MMAANLNKVMLIGNLTRDVELKYLQGGTAIASFSLAINRTWFDKANNEKKQEVEFVNITVFGKSAENCANYLSKGKSAFVEGRLKTETWEDRNGGGKRARTVVIADSVQFLGAKGENRPAEDVRGAASEGPFGEDEGVPE